MSRLQQSIRHDATAGQCLATVTLPATARRSDLSYVRILSGAFADRRYGGWRLEGPLEKPGARVPWRERMVAVEMAGRARTGHGHRRSDYLYILWVWENGAWREAARAVSACWDWMPVLGPVARKLLGEGARDEAVAARIEDLLGAIDRALSEVPPELRPLVCAGVEERLSAGRAAA